ncbi:MULTISPECIES: porin family protein [unclassified Chitinophaga]|uniref:porin family protein n=1 Tax=unclassified Chitinophaga TaxID=2619133 RepID=UPI0009D12E87|nr:MULTISPECIES: porin family protein [unclassified Chitinophaga]OMP75582.1 hypothetical protein BW716_29490 [[Flexibacter] sp. ATCC 35208]WPV64572.1 porin family protein [Chitinophaga sp. LS1]
MKKIILAFGLLSISYTTFAQSSLKSAVAKSADYLVIQAGYVNMNGTGASSLHMGFNRTLNVALMYDIPLSESKFSLGAGLGIGSDHYYFSKEKIDITNTTSPSRTASDNYKHSKMATTYLEIPLELRFHQRQDNLNKGFKVAVGVKTGYLLNAHTRLVNNQTGHNVTEVESSKYWFNTIRFAGTARIGWGNYALFGTYALNNIFKSNNTYAVKAYTVGISFGGF